MADQFKNVENRTNPAKRWIALTASASPLALEPRGIKCVVAGDITIEDAFGVAMTIPSAAAIGEHAVGPYKVTAVAGTWFGLY